jgi:hypothetical protein
MQPFPPLFIAAFVFLCAVGLLIGLLAIRARQRRQLLRGIPVSVDAHFLHFAPRLRGDPAALRLSGYTFSGLHWTLRTYGANGNERSCRARLELNFPDLAGDPDVAVVPRDGNGRPAAIASRLPEMREFPTGVPGFDSKYEVIAVPGQISSPPVNRGLAERFLNWPRDTVAGQAVTAWRDLSGCHLEARLQTAPNWETIRYFLALGEDFCAQLPAPAFSRHAPQRDLAATAR